MTTTTAATTATTINTQLLYCLYHNTFWTVSLYEHLIWQLKSRNFCTVNKYQIQASMKCCTIFDTHYAGQCSLHGQCRLHDVLMSLLSGQVELHTTGSIAVCLFLNEPGRHCWWGSKCSDRVDPAVPPGWQPFILDSAGHNQAAQLPTVDGQWVVIFPVSPMCSRGTGGPSSTPVHKLHNSPTVEDRISDDVISSWGTPLASSLYKLLT